MSEKIVRAGEKSSPFVVDGHSIRRDGDMWCMTDLWRAAGGPQNRRPNDWLSTDAAREFCEYVVAANYPGATTAGRAGTRKKPGIPGKEPPTTWGHWQIALAYAKALSHPFHARVNEVYRAYTDGLLAPKESVASQELIRLSLRLEAMNRADYESVWDLELKLELARLRRCKWDGSGIEPRQLTFAYGRTWRIVLGDAVYEELKRRNPYPKDGSLHGQWLQEQRLQMTRRESMVIALVLARRSSRWSEYEDEMRGHFQRTPIQLRLVASNTRRLPSKSRGA